MTDVAILLPCPFCGGAPQSLWHVKGVRWVVMCNVAGCKSQPGVIARTEAQARGQWNTRVTPTGYEVADKDMPRVNWETAKPADLLRAYSWHLQRATGGQVLYGDAMLRRMSATPEASR